jgi:hypothetical protein
MRKKDMLVKLFYATRGVGKDCSRGIFYEPEHGDERGELWWRPSNQGLIDFITRLAFASNVSIRRSHARV